MNLLDLIIVPAVAGVLLWLFNTYVPSEATLKRIVNAIVIIFIVFWLISKLFGIDLRNINI